MSQMQERPEEPLPTDCCNSGCNPCILDVYKDLLENWEIEQRAIQAGIKVNSSASNRPVNTLSQTKYTFFKLMKICSMTSDSNLYSFKSVVKHENNESEKSEEFEEVRQSLEIEATQYLIMQGNSSEATKITRAYTPIAWNKDVPGSFEVVIKLYPGGKMSHFVQMLQIGDIVSWRGPYGGIKYTCNTFQHLLMLCAGTGIAPMYSLASKIVNDETDDTVLKLIYCCRDINNIILRKEIHALQAFWNFSAVIHLSHQTESDYKPYYGETINCCRLLEPNIDGELRNRRLNTLVLICGTVSFCEEMEKIVRHCDVPPKNIHVF